MRTLAALLLLSLLGCRSTTAPDISSATLNHPSHEWLAEHPPAADARPSAPTLRGLRAYTQGDSVIVEASIAPSVDPAVTPWTVWGAFHVGEGWQEFGFGPRDYLWPAEEWLVEFFDGQYIGAATYWRDPHRMRLAIALWNPAYSLTGEMRLTLVAQGAAGTTYTIYTTTVREPHGRGQIAADVLP